MSSVKLAEWWPSQRCTCTTFLPSANSRDATVWRNVWKPAHSTPAAYGLRQGDHVAFIDEQLNIPPGSRPAIIHGAMATTTREPSRSDSSRSAVMLAVVVATESSM